MRLARIMAALRARPLNQGGQQLQGDDMIAEKKSRGTPEQAAEPLFRSVDQRRADRADNWFEQNVRAAQKKAFGVEGTLTPELAEKLLSQNVDNRSLSRTNIDRIRKDIEHGHWEVNGETIIISREGLLNDGQHRCRAVVESGQPVKTAFWFGADRRTRMTVDTGQARTVGMFLDMHGVKNGKAVATVCNNVIQLRRHGYIYGSPEKLPTKQESLEFWHANRDIEDSVAFVPGDTNKVGGRNILATVHYILRDVDPVQADYFIQRLAYGDGLERSDPIYKLREHLTDKYEKARGGNREARLSAGNKVEIILRAWNHKRRGERMSRPQIHGRIPQVR